MRTPDLSVGMRRAARTVVTAVILGTASAACVTLPPPTDTVARAGISIDKAEQAGAGQYAPDAMRAARKSLERARELTSVNENLEARYAAEIAVGQAELARAIAEAERADQHADKAENELARVKREIETERGTQ